MNTLIIDTADNKKILVGLKIKGKEYILTKKIRSNKSQIVLSQIEKMLKKYSVRLKEISAIQVNAGPGSFTGLRVGVAVANALSYVLEIPVNGKKVGEIITPFY